ncbi:MAG: glycoside hydrolase family 71/99-like protein [Chthoniobacteraceae bacterium]
MRVRLVLLAIGCALEMAHGDAVDATTLRGKVMAGYQGWFRCPGDAAGMGWVHWSRDGKRLAGETLTFEMWPEMSEYTERFAAPGFTYPDGTQAELFSSDSAATVLRHFQWMRDYGIDGAWLQHFVVDLPGGPAQARFASRLRTLGHVRAAANETGRAWALAYDISGMPAERLFETLARDWQKLVDDGLTKDPCYLHEGGKPVVEVWGFYFQNQANAMTAEIANRIIDFFKAPGPYQAFLVGGGDWNWRRNPDPAWQKMYRRFDAYSPWNVGNLTLDRAGDAHATTSYWADDKAECEKAGMRWLPVVYPGFSWDNLQKKPPGSTNIPRRGGKFLWEQFHALAKLGVDSVCVAMFDEVDEATAIFKVTSTPPTQAHFVGYEGLPSDWYLRLVGEGGKMLRGKIPVIREIPIRP